MCEVSKFELNKRLAELLGYTRQANNTEIGLHELDNDCTLTEDQSLMYLDGSSFCTVKADYCNDWGQLMPLVIRYNVSLTSISDDEFAAHDGYWHHGGMIVDDTNSNFTVDGDTAQISLVKCLIAKLESEL